MKAELPRSDIVNPHLLPPENLEKRCDLMKCLSITSFVVALIALIVGVLILAKVGAFNSVGSGWGGAMVGVAMPLIIISYLIAELQKKSDSLKNSDVQKTVSSSENASAQVEEPYTLDLCKGEKAHDTIHGPAVKNWQKSQWDALVAKAGQIQHLCITLGDTAAWCGLVSHLYLLKGLKRLHINDLSKEYDKSSIDDLAETVAQRKISVRISSCGNTYNNSADYASRKGNWYGPGGTGTSVYECASDPDNHRLNHRHQIAKFPRTN